LDEADIRYLERTLDLAENGRGCTSPNPMVGAVIVKGSTIIGEGYHIGPGRDHAEVAAIKDALRRAGLPVGGDRSAEAGRNAVSARELLAGTTMYVSLEPCCTYGRTPPCTGALIGAGFGRIVVGAIDPSPGVDGKGIKILREAGMEVDIAEGALAHRARRQNGGVRKAVRFGLPFVTYKYAMTLDGRVATDAGDSRWISSGESRRLVHQWRAWADAVVVGAGTLLADDPTLTARDVECRRQPLRVVVDEALRLDRESALVTTINEGPVLALCGPEIGDARRAEVESWGVETAVVRTGENGGLDPAAVGRCLVDHEVREVLLEGGPRLAGAWWAAGCIDKVATFVCPRIATGVQNRGPLNVAGPARMQDSMGLLDVEVMQSGVDVLISGYTGEPF
jgi:diaminohydroxyphosphoribosylaminopyrimidine deaminase/5-amino-6-(5-phosphoribosylamino)uracil reductase